MEMEWLAYLLLFFTGFVDAIAGGGGLISLPTFLAVGVPAHMALGTNKFSVFAGTGISAAYFAKKGHVQWSTALIAFTGALISSALGARIALLVDERVLSWLLIAAVPVVAVVLFTKKEFGAETKTMSIARARTYSFAIGLAIGAYDGFFGPGTGTFLIMAFTLVMGMNLMDACGNTKVVNFASNVAAVVLFIVKGEVDYRLGVPCALCAIIGNWIGSRLAIRNGARIVRPMMVFVILLLLGKVVVDLVRG